MSVRPPLAPPAAVSISPSRVAYVLYALVGMLALAHVAVHAVLYVYGQIPERFEGLYRFFNMGMEANLPTYASALNLLIAAALLALTAWKSVHLSTQEEKQPSRWHWTGLAVGFLIMSFDEAAQIHEGLVGAFMLDTVGRGDGVLYYVWYQVYIPVLLVVGFFYVPFLRRLPRRYAVWFVLAGGVFVGGAVGIEMIESYLSYSNRSGKSISRLFEETCEMLGVALFIHALLRYLVEAGASVTFRFEDRSEARVPLPD